MPEDDIRRIMVALGKIEVSIEALRAENQLGQKEHDDFEVRLRRIEHIDPADVEARLRGLERVRWALYGVSAVLGSGVGAALVEVLKG